MIWLNPAPQKEDIWKIYRSYYTHNESASAIQRLLKKVETGYHSLKYGYRSSIFKKVLGLIAYLLPTEKVEFDFEILYLPHPGRKNKLLDVGCGSGRFLSKMRDLGWMVKGVEIDEKAVETCRVNGLEVIKGELTELDLKNETFDVITLNHVIEHHFDPQALLKKCYDLLSTNGRLVVLTPNSKSYSFLKFGFNWHHLDPPRHLLIFNPNNLTQITNNAGFVKIITSTTSRNEYWVYHSSQFIKRMGQNKLKNSYKSIRWIVFGKFYQLMISVLLIFKKDAGSEIVLKAVK